MSFWVWIAIGALSLTSFSLLVGLVVARILGNIGREVSHVLEAEAEAWVMAPLTHATQERVGITPDEVISQPHSVRSREEEVVASGHPDRAAQPPRAGPADANSRVSAARAGVRRRPHRSPPAPGRRRDPQPLRR
jgi:hypothetical protein